MTTPTIRTDHRTAPWNAVYTLAGEIKPDSWMLVGGLMVQAHAMLAGKDFRPTSDADFMADVLADNLSATHIVRALERHGYSLRTGTLTGYSSRMTNDDGDVVDIMSPDHLPRWTARKQLTVVHGENIFTTPGGAQALDRCMSLALEDGDTRCVIRIPDQLGALILKAAAWMADSGDKRSRHLQDAMILCLVMNDPENQRLRLHSRNDRRRLRALRESFIGDDGRLDMFPQSDVDYAVDLLTELLRD
ncbi:hypothetical protein [uncultured Bifidobacterium sp.]|uniref:hypothetical protein n=1 Tax=uncultured Bifidobacterium sp. TaxID=165187 RepID=UPI00258D8E73|nr:hypothetical protein [uncultured Bifidobacterium sp.]